MSISWFPLFQPPQHMAAWLPSMLNESIIYSEVTTKVKSGHSGMSAWTRAEASSSSRKVTWNSVS